MSSLRLIFLIFNILIGTALASDITIYSEDVEINRTTNISKFASGVILWFYDEKNPSDVILLKTNDMVVKYSASDVQKSISEISIPNKVMVIRSSVSMPKDSIEIVIADSAEYDHSKKLVVLSGNVISEYKNHILKTDKLVYHAELINKISQ